MKGGDGNEEISRISISRRYALRYARDGSVQSFSSSCFFFSRRSGSNNAVVEVPGVPDAVPAAQGGHVIINGAPSNLTFVLTKPSATQVTAAKEQATLLGGKILNVFGTKSAISKFTSAKVNFYMKGVKAGQLIDVYQLVNGEWVKVTVAEIREDHVVVELAQHGLLVFVEVPAAAAN